MTWLWLTIGCGIALAVGDVLLWARGGVRATISRHVIAILAAYPIVGVLFGVAVGVLLGHLAWPQPIPGLCP